jgi:hypothetical protein
MPTPARRVGADPYRVLMTRDEATARAAALNAEASADEHWLVREAPSGEWTVAKLTGPGLGATRATGTHSESRPKPEQPDDPRPALFRNIPPLGPA